MQEFYLPRCRIYAAVLWVMCLLAFVATWVVMWVQPHAWHLAGLLAFTSTTLAVVAGVLQVRAYLVQVCELVRAAHGDHAQSAEIERAGLRSVP